jgi:hypothetical protein
MATSHDRNRDAIIPSSNYAPRNKSERFTRPFLIYINFRRDLGIYLSHRRPYKMNMMPDRMWETTRRGAENMMLMPAVAAVLGVLGIVCLFLSALLGGTSIADWVLDAAQAFLVVAALVFLFYVARGIALDIADAA